MAQIIHDVDLPNTGNGDPLRTAFVNQNEINTELYDTKVDKVTGKDLSSNDYTDLEKSKLAGIEEGAQVNVPINYTDIVGAPIFNNIAAYPETKYDYLDTNVFVIPENVQAITVRKNGDSTDNLEDWTQFGDEVTYLGTLTTGDYLIIGGVFVIPSGGGGTPSDLITKFTSNPSPSIVGTDILVPEDETWLIDSVPYTNPTVSTIPFSYAPDGLLYFLTVVATKFNTFIGKFGTASADPSEPIVNNDELFLTTYLISDGTIEVVIPPVNPNIYVEKESFAPLTLISSGHVASIELDKRNNIIFSGNITKTGNVIKNNSNHFVIGLPFTTTNKTANPIEIQHMNTSGGSGSIAYFNTEELSYFLQPNEVAIWVSEILNGQKIHRRVSSYINRDNVIYRSGTEAGKPVTGDVEIRDGISLVTEEVGGTKSLLKSKVGKWQIEIEDGINSSLTLFDPDKGIFSDKLFDIDNDENAYLQKGHIVQLEEDVFNLELNKLDASAYNDRFKGVFATETALFLAYPTAQAGDSAQVNETGSTKVVNYSWDAEDNVWVVGGSGGSGALNTDALPEGASNFYFTTARVLATLLTGLSLVTGGAIVSTDSVLVAFGKIQKQLNDFGIALGLKAPLANPTFTGSVIVPNATNNNEAVALGQVLKTQITKSGNQTLDNTYNGKVVTFTGSGTFTVNNTIAEEGSFALKVETGVTVAWAITAPATWRVGGLTVGTAPRSLVGGDMVYLARKGSSNEIEVYGL